MSAEFNTMLKGIREQLEAGYPVDSLDRKAKKVIDDFLEISCEGDNIRVRYNEEAISKAKADFGIFSLLTYGTSPMLSDTTRTFKEYPKSRIMVWY